jgi:hypothetical protein
MSCRAWAAGTVDLYRLAWLLQWVGFQQQAVLYLCGYSHITLILCPTTGSHAVTIPPDICFPDVVSQHIWVVCCSHPIAFKQVVH